VKERERKGEIAINHSKRCVGIDEPLEEELGREEGQDSTRSTKIMKTTIRLRKNYPQTRSWKALDWIRRRGKKIRNLTQLARGPVDPRLG